MTVKNSISVDLSNELPQMTEMINSISSELKKIGEVNGSILKSVQLVSLGMDSSYLKNVNITSDILAKSLGKVSLDYTKSLNPLIKMSNPLSKQLEGSFNDLTRNAFASFAKSLNFSGALTKISSSSLERVATSLSAALSNVEFDEIDFSGINTTNNAKPSYLDISYEVDVNKGVLKVAEESDPYLSGKSDSKKVVNLDETNTKKTVADMDEADLRRIFSESILITQTKEDSGADTKKRTFSLAAFFLETCRDYALDHSKAVLHLLIMYIIPIVTNIYNDAQYNSEVKQQEVKQQIVANIQDFQEVREVRKTIPRDVRYELTDQVGFLRTNVLLRSGASKDAPLEVQDVLTTNTVLTILVREDRKMERKGNWIKVQVESGDLIGEKGWIQESTVIKFKKEE